MEVLSGIRVVDVTAYSFCPAAGAVLAHWDADVVKVEPAHTPETGRRAAERVPDFTGDSEGTSYWHRGGFDLATWWGRGSLADGASKAASTEFPPCMTGHGDGMAGGRRVRGGGSRRTKCSAS